MAAIAPRSNIMCVKTNNMRINITKQVDSRDKEILLVGQKRGDPGYFDGTDAPPVILMFDLSNIPPPGICLEPTDPIYKKENLRIQIAAELPQGATKEVFRFEFAPEDVEICTGNAFVLKKSVTYKDKQAASSSTGRAPAARGGMGPRGKATKPSKELTVEIAFKIDFKTEDPHFSCIMEMNGAKINF